MEQKARNELQDGRNFVREVFRRMEMTGVEAVEELVFDSIGEVELVRADDIAFRTNTEELALDRIEIERTVHRRCKNLIQRGGKALAR